MIRRAIVCPALLVALSLTACGEQPDPYTGPGPDLSGTYDIQESQEHEGCDGDAMPLDRQGVFRLEKYGPGDGEYLGWFPCTSAEQCQDEPERDQSFYDPRPNSWLRVSNWAVEGPGVCHLRHEVAEARLDDSTLTVTTHRYAKEGDPERCTKTSARSIRRDENCQTREVLVAESVE